MRLAHAIRRRFVVAVQSQPYQRRPVEAAVVLPEAGARWGRPATFDQASRPQPSDEPTGFTAEWIDTYRLFKGVESHREYSSAPAAVGDQTLQPEGIRSVTFYCGAQKERRDLGGVIYTSLIHHYVKFDFPVLAFVGARGQPHPPPTAEDDQDA